MSTQQSTAVQDGTHRTVPPLASWGRRVGAMLLDHLVAAAPWVVAGPYAALTAERGTDIFGDPTVMTTTAGDWAILAATGLHLLLWVANRWILQGRTGQSIGKRVLGLRLADARTVATPAAGRTIGREFAHLADYPAAFGYLMPLWDTKKQTLADKIVGTVVVMS